MISRSLKTGDEIAEDVRLLLINRGLKQSVGLTGNVYPYKRPDNSDKEDVVVKCLVLDSMQMQEGVVNVNVHVPSISAGPAGYQPNRIRLNEIGKVAADLLDDTWGFDYNFELDEAPIIQPEQIADRWFLNIRVRYHAARLDNESIDN